MKRIVFFTAVFYAIFLTFVSYRVSKAYFSDMAVSTTNTFTAASEFPTDPQTTPTGVIVLNEILYRPSQENPDWIEIYNNSAEDISLSGWVIRDLTATNIEELDTLGVIAPNSFKTIDVGNMLNADSDTVFLNDSNGNTVDSYTYGAPNTATDQSIGRNVDGTGSWKTCIITTKNTSNNDNC